MSDNEVQGERPTTTTQTTMSDHNTDDGDELNSARYEGNQTTDLGASTDDLLANLNEMKEDN